MHSLDSSLLIQNSLIKIFASVFLLASLTFIISGILFTYIFFDNFFVISSCGVK
ncbi:hypothetical protein RhiirA4_257249 [Rhizophagus irregularis]|uniref:Uncharacterized protein n=1 Tax=Rhizophagus irregularis TaxID=588596 RepID=A0A2I1FZV8_9GLOM|nr:hypothetical protein RhiirA4_257249 [Rhizophagus irregularis]